MSDQIVFLCLHGAAKSVIAAAYCQRLADQRNVPLRAQDVAAAAAIYERAREAGIGYVLAR